MKKFGGLFLVALLAGAITLGTYIYFFGGPQVTILGQSTEFPVLQTRNTGLSGLPSGISELDFTAAAEKTVNAVVHVQNVTLTRRSNPLLEFFYGSETKAVPQVGTGSGVIISPDGYIVTNNHVIAKATHLKVTLNNNSTYDASVIGTDEDSDIALIKIDTEEVLPYLAFGDSDNTKIGEWVLAVGNPFNLTSTVTAGIVSAKARNMGVGKTFIQTDAAVNPGNSGGALVNTNGDLIGINTAITSQTGGFVGYSFAVPSNIARKIVEDIMEFGKVQKGILGISSIAKNNPLAVEKGVTDVDGVYIQSIENGSGAEVAGLEPGDIIKQIDNIRVRKYSDLSGYIAAKRPGDEVDVSVTRNGRELTLPVTLTRRLSVRLNVINLEVRELSKEDKRIFRTDSGVKITGVPEDYASYKLYGKVMVRVNGRQVRDIDEAKQFFDKITNYDRFSITLVGEEGERERLIFH